MKNIFLLQATLFTTYFCISGQIKSFITLFLPFLKFKNSPRGKERPAQS